VVAALIVLALWQGPGLLAGSDGPAGLGASSGSTDRAGGTDDVSGLSWVDAASLPPEALDTLELIDAGGPFPYEQDGGIFSNNERILPLHERGYYHEYTVETPGSDDRGARRIVTGADGELYWTGDHYQSFERIQR
jgi:ribonuclease T1